MKLRVIKKRRIEIEDDCREWAREIKQTYIPELIVFVANSGFICGKTMADELGGPLDYVKAVRSGNSAKNRLSQIKKFIPQGLVEIILSSPLKFYIHSIKKDRHVELSRKLDEYCDGGITRVLLVDDAADTGWTLKQVVDKLKERFPEIEIRTASYTVSDYSRKIFSVDYYRYRNMLIFTATSRKSDEYNDYIKDLFEWYEKKKLL